ncbi:MAG: hypothetical protein EOO13_10855 [Chitinophagaceae bacterium]|nr:MAG: hypothetical protein EOO13_10855 [Chitinophagaceae bacterium]
MKTFKTCDYCISIALMIATLIYGLIKLDHSFLLGYFVVGSWQMISMLVHIYSDWFNSKGSKRNVYHNVIRALLALLVIGFFVQGLLYPLLVIVFLAGPFMAVYYTHLCYQEVNVKMQRPLAQLK